MQVTRTNLGGYLLAFGGVCYYNYTKLQAMQARAASASAAQKGRSEVDALAPAVASETMPLKAGINGKGSNAI